VASDVKHRIATAHAFSDSLMVLQVAATGLGAQFPDRRRRSLASGERYHANAAG
jgi:hypothetical protein